MSIIHSEVTKIQVMTTIFGILIVRKICMDTTGKKLLNDIICMETFCLKCLCPRYSQVAEKETVGHFKNCSN